MSTTLTLRSLPDALIAPASEPTTARSAIASEILALSDGAGECLHQVMELDTILGDHPDAHEFLEGLSGQILALQERIDAVATRTERIVSWDALDALGSEVVRLEQHARGMHACGIPDAADAAIASAASFATIKASLYVLLPARAVAYQREVEDEALLAATSS
jgi:hypothetical protein